MVWRFKREGDKGDSISITEKDSHVEQSESVKKNIKTVISSESQESIIDIDENDTSFVEGDVSKMNNSPYPEVRAAVSTEFNQERVLNHWRMWSLTTVFVIVFAGVNQFFSLRYPTLTIGYVVAQVIVYPIGTTLAKLPKTNSKIPFFDLNPGPFTKQEHAIVTIIVALTSSTAYAMNILIAQTNFFNMDVRVGYQLLLVLSTQLLGYGAAGLTRRWIVYPASMTWPQNLVTSTVFSALARSNLAENIEVKSLKWSRYKMFLVVTGVSFVWYWFPGFIFVALSYFNWVCWIAPKNIVVNQVFGVSSGLGIIPITFDWTQITQAMGGVSPLATPFWVSANTYGAVFIFFVILLPILYYTNHWDAKYFPMISSSNYDNKQQTYNASKILGSNLRVDRAKYRAYSPVFVSYSYLLSYGMNFAAIIAIFVHSALYSGKDIVKKLKHAESGGEDIHKRLMNKYKEAPDWWYWILLAVSIGLSFGAISGYSEESGMPAWGLVVALAITFIGFIPQGLLEGLTNQHVGLNIITELVGGYIFPGNPLANMMIKLYGFIPMRQGLDFSRDLKLAQYMKVPPRLLFFLQIYGTVLACLVNVGVQQWMRFHVNNICEEPPFSCPNGKVISTAAITFSLVGELFSPGKRYNAILYFFLIGLVFPIITYVLYRKFPKKWYGHINGPIFFTGSGNIPPSTLYNYSLYFSTCFLFNFYIKKYYTAFHTRYNNVISAGFDAGVAISAVVIFLCVVYPGGKLTWWGNEVYANTKDFESAPFYTLKPGQTIGPKHW